MTAVKSINQFQLYHFIPIFSSFFWSACVPASCDYHDFQVIIQGQFNVYLNGTDVIIKIKSDDKLCQTESQEDILKIGSTLVM